jgi:hypothetical protein
MSQKSPWISIWCEPRATISQIVAENPNRSLWVLAFIYGFLSILNSFQSISIGTMMGFFASLVIALILSPFWGYAIFSVWSWVVCKIGRCLKGQGDFVSIRAAFAWSSVPLTVNIVFWFLMIFSFGAPFFFNPNEMYPLSSQQSAFLLLILVGKVVIAIWSLVIYLNALAEVQKFSILRTIFNVIFSWIVVGVILAALWFAFLSIIQMTSPSSNLTSWILGLDLLGAIL